MLDFVISFIRDAPFTPKQAQDMLRTKALTLMSENHVRMDLYRLYKMGFLKKARAEPLLTYELTTKAFTYYLGYANKNIPSKEELAKAILNTDAQINKIKDDVSQKNLINLILLNRMNDRIRSLESAFALFQARHP